MRQRALGRGLSLSEWGLVPAGGEGTVKEKAGLAQKRGAETEARAEGAAPLAPALVRNRADHGASPSIQTEKDLFDLLGLRFVPPELREGMGEIEAAEKGEFPRLVEAADLRGAFHNHTTASDGRNTLSEMVAAAQALGWEYFGLADHSKSSFQANGLTEERVLQQIEEVRALNAAKKFKTHVFMGVEVDILVDGRLDYDDAVLRQLDYIVASVHNAFAQDEATMTKRVVKALEHPCTTMLGHLTGRLLLRREGYKVDAAKAIDAAIANGVIIELNASPWRLDMDWRLWRKAADRGLLCAINPDAHETEGLDHVRAGVNAARKGGLTKENVLNTRPLKEVKEYFAQRGSKGG
jgi:DNA polymerase (family 10)